MALGVSGSGEAKINASRIAFSSAAARGAPSCNSAILPSCIVAFLSTVGLRIADRMRRVRRTRTFVDADRAEAARLEHPHELQSNHLEERQERDDEAAAIASVGEQLVEPARLGFGQTLEELL